MSDYKPIGIDTAVNMLSQLFGSPYIVPADKEAKELLDRYNVINVSEETPDRLSQFGTPVFGTFWAMPDDLPYKIWSHDNKLVTRDYEPFEFPVATIIDFSRPKIIVKEKTNGGKGSVKEIMGLDDWDINIRGLIVDDESRTGQKTAKQQQYALDRLNEIAGAIKVSGKIFEERYISHIVFETPRYSAIQGKRGLIQYEIQAYSDESFLLADL